MANHTLGRGYNTALVTWAENMVTAGFESEDLYVLLGETTPFNVFEMKELLSKILAELGVPEISSQDEAIALLVTGQVRRFLADEVGCEAMLGAVHEAIMHGDFGGSFHDFYLLYYAMSSLNETDGTFQPYWDGATFDNTDEVTRTVCEEWIAENTLENWAQFEWSPDLS